MKIDELITKLEDLKEEHGNLETGVLRDSYGVKARAIEVEKDAGDVTGDGSINKIVWIKDRDH